jgi:hypothetical protein
MQKLGHNSSMLLHLKLARIFDEWPTATADGFVNPVLEVPGLIWKVWVLNQQEKLTGGIYLFQPAGARLVI